MRIAHPGTVLHLVSLVRKSEQLIISMPESVGYLPRIDHGCKIIANHEAYQVSIDCKGRGDLHAHEVCAPIEVFETTYPVMGNS